MKLFAPIIVLLLCASLVSSHLRSQGRSQFLGNQHQQIDLAARSLDFQTLTSLSASNSSEPLRRAYIEYRLALAAEEAGNLALMKTALEQAESALEHQNQGADIQALGAAIHLRRMLHSDHPELHRQQLDAALTRAYQLEADNPSVLLVAAMVAHYSPEGVGGGQVLADLMLHEAGVQFKRRCSHICASSERTYIWQGLARSMERETGEAGPRLLAQANCQQLSAMAGS